MSKDVCDVLAKELQRLNNISPNLPHKEEIKIVLKHHLDPYLDSIDNNVLCPRVWEKFYNFWKDVNPEENEYPVLPIWMTSEHMMRRYPKFFTNATMMSGPTTIAGRKKDGAKMIVSDTVDVFAVYNFPSTKNGMLEDIQDTKAVGTHILGSNLTALVNENCDFLAKKWNKIIENGGTVYPYLPLVMYSQEKKWNSKIFFKSRYGVYIE